jgi:uncharacterized protein (UPF0262 family)
MGEPRIIAIDLDERSIIRRNEDIEQERRVAIFDLLEGNHFDLTGHEGPFRVQMRVEDGRLAIDVRGGGWAARAGSSRPGAIPPADPRLFPHLRQLFQSRAVGDPKGIEAIDMARRGIHNEAAELLKECLSPQVEVDFDTARRLFTLICVLHIKAGPMVVEQSGMEG